MKLGFYPKLAFDGIRKNKRMYVPYLLTCIGMAAMYYIMFFLHSSETIAYLKGANTVRESMRFGGWVMAIFACIFLFYTNSFLMRRRKKEFGLYHVLGMGKRNIGVMLFWETLILFVLSIGSGLLVGMVLSKLAELGLVNLIREEVTYRLSVSPDAIWMTLLVFGGIFVLLFLNSLRQIKFSSAISLVRSDQVGEKPPKANWFVGLLGAVILIVAYYLAVTIQNPIAALSRFFLAVVMVIVSTYMLMITGSVVFCRFLQKRKTYYYKPNHFISVSSMVYRMKRNGAGLASICILATMVLVIVSTTTTLYFSAEATLKQHYPRDVMVQLGIRDAQRFSEETADSVSNQLFRMVDQKGAEIRNQIDFCSASFSGRLRGTTLEADPGFSFRYYFDAQTGAVQCYFVSLSDYNRLNGTNEALSPGEAMLYTNRTDYREDTLTIHGGTTFRIKKTVAGFTGQELFGIDSVPASSVLVLFVPDFASAVFGNQHAIASTSRSISWVCAFDTDLPPSAQLELSDALYHNTLSLLPPDENVGDDSAGWDWYTFGSRAEAREGYYGVYGSLFFLGILLSIVFLFAAVLIIYYKQISEGYEDQSRFEIMQKVGMTKRDIRKSINSQLLTVFFLPLIGAGCHLAFAFPMIRSLMHLFEMYNIMLFAWTTILTFLVFAVFYTLVYRVTSNAYYHIVSGARDTAGV